MRIRLNVHEMSQNFQAAACGLTTAHVIIKHHSAHQPVAQQKIEQLNKLLGGTKTRIFKWRMVRSLRKLLGEQYIVEECSLTEAIEQLRHGNPVALNFDQYTSLQFFSKQQPLFKYRWVPLIGYNTQNHYLELIIHDNDKGNDNYNPSSDIRTFSYDENRHVLSFIKIEPKK